MTTFKYSRPNKLIAQLDEEEIKQLIPQRGPMLMVKSAIVYNLEDGEEIEANYMVHSDSIFMDGHFPGNKMFPGMLICEVMAQAGAVLFSQLNPKFAGCPPILAGVERLRLKNPVRPGDRLCAYAKIKKITNGSRMTIVDFDCHAKVIRYDGDDNETEYAVATAEITGICQKS